jgi:nucleolin
MTQLLPEVGQRRATPLRRISPEPNDANNRVKSMTSKLFIGNLGFSTDEAQLRSAFEAIGALVSAVVVKDRSTGQSRGFGFVEYRSGSDAERAMESLNGSMLDGRAIRVSVANERGAR